MVVCTKMSCEEGVVPVVLVWERGKQKSGRKVRNLKILLNEKDYEKIPLLTKLKMEIYLNSLYRLWKFNSIKTENDLEVFSNMFVCEHSPKFFFLRKKMFRSKVMNTNITLKEALFPYSSFTVFNDKYFVKKYKKEKKELIKSRNGRKKEN